MLENYDKTMQPEEVIASIQRKKDCTKAQAMKILRKEIPLEKFYQKKVLQGLKRVYPDGFIRKVTLAQYSEGGMPDILAIIDGHYFGFEIKRPILGEASPIQKKTIEMIRRAGGTAEIISYPEQAIEAIRDYFKEI